MISDYSTYENYVSTILASGDVTDTAFKSNPAYTYVLEHVSPAFGHQYLELIKASTSLSLDDVKRFCQINDSIGNPAKCVMMDVYASPSSLRYVYHAHLLLTHIKNLGLAECDIVEVGAGYGGLFLCVDFLHETYGIAVKSYTMVDLELPNQLQAMYISKFTTKIVSKFVDSRNYGAEVEGLSLVLVSNYCFSEIEEKHRAGYIATLMPKVAHGFMCWNHIPVVDFGFPVNICDEVPLTGDNFNKYVSF